MKKAIYLTIGSVILTSGIVATSVLLPTLTATSNIYPFCIYNYNPNNLDDISSENLQLKSSDFESINVRYQDLIVGNTNFNNGNYVLCISSQAYNSNNSFLYGPQGDNYIDSTVTETNQQPILNGDFGAGLKLIPDLVTQPKILIIQDVLTEADYRDEEEYNNLVQEYKNIDISSSNYDEDTDEYKKYNWAQQAKTFSFSPGDTYETWDGKTEYFRKTNKFPILFNKIVDFTKSVFNNLSNLESSSGIIIGYKNNELTTEYSGSFSSSSGDSSSESTSTQSNFYSSFSTKSQSSFEKWLVDNYESKK